MHVHWTRESKQVGTFRWSFCRCGDTRVAWHPDGRMVPAWTSSWGRSAAVEGELSQYFREAVSGGEAAR